MDKVIFCTFHVRVDSITRVYTVSLSEIIAYPEFNLENVPPELTT